MCWCIVSTAAAIGDNPESCCYTGLFFFPSFFHFAAFCSSWFTNEKRKWTLVMCVSKIPNEKKEQTIQNHNWQWIRAISVKSSLSSNHNPKTSFIHLTCFFSLCERTKGIPKEMKTLKTNIKWIKLNKDTIHKCHGEKWKRLEGTQERKSYNLAITITSTRWLWRWRWQQSEVCVTCHEKNLINTENKKVFN